MHVSRLRWKLGNEGIVRLMMKRTKESITRKIFQRLKFRWSNQEKNSTEIFEDPLNMEKITKHPAKRDSTLVQILQLILLFYREETTNNEKLAPEILNHPNNISTH